MRGEEAAPRQGVALRVRLRRERTAARSIRAGAVERQRLTGGREGPPPRPSPCDDGPHPRRRPPVREGGRARRRSPGRRSSPTTSMLPRMLHCKLLRSKIAHARIVSIDVSQALAAAGRRRRRDRQGPADPLRHPARSRRTSTRSASTACASSAIRSRPSRPSTRTPRSTRSTSIEVEYEPLPPIGTIEEASRRPRPPIHDYGDAGNIHKLVSMEFGDTEEGFARADRVYEDLFFYEGNTHLPLEQHAAVADFGPDGKLTLWSSTQTPHYVHRALAKVLEMPPAKIRVIATPNGGGFGGKSDPFNHEIVVAHLSRVTGRPVKICLTREEVFYCHRGRHPTLMQRADRREEGRRDHGDALPDGPRRRRLRLLRRRLDVLHGRAADGDLPGARRTASTARASSRTSRPAAPSAATARRSRASRSRSQLDKIACDLGLDPAEIRREHLQPAELADRELPARRLDGPRRLHRQGRRGLRLEEAARQAARRARASASRARRTSAARACRSTGTRCRSRACS